MAASSEISISPGHIRRLNGFYVHAGWQPKGKTPQEAYKDFVPANSKPRFEPRSRWPRGSPCAAPQTMIQGKSGSRLVLVIGFYEGRKHLPIIELKRVA